MTPRPDAQSVSNTKSGAGWEQGAIVEDYLDHICAPLIGIVPYARRHQLRLEIASHLEALAEEYRFQGQTLPDATESALREFGVPWQIGASFLHEWVQGAADTAPRLLTRRATVRAFACFGPFTVAILLLLEQAVLTPGCGGLMSWAVLLSVVTPVFAGITVGWTLPPRGARGVAWAVGLLALDTAVTALLLLPHREGLQLAAFQLLFWLPLGCLTATTTATILRQHRRRQFRRLAR